MLEARDGLQSTQSDLQIVRDELLTSQSELRGSREKLRDARDELSYKTALLDEARHEASEAMSSAERLTEECCGLRGDLHQKVTLVAQRDEVIRRLRNKACTQLGGLPFRGKLLMFIQTWISISTSLATRRQRSSSP